MKFSGLVPPLTLPVLLFCSYSTQAYALGGANEPLNDMELQHLETSDTYPQPVMDRHIVDRIMVPVAHDPDHTERPVVVFRPTEIDPDWSYPLVLYFHGYGENNDVSFIGRAQSGSIDTSPLSNARTRLALVRGPDTQSGYIDTSPLSNTNNYVRIVYDAWRRLIDENPVARDWFLVMIDGRSCLDGTFYIDSRYSGLLGTWATQDVPAYLEKRYGVKFSTDPRMNATAGHSMGGYAALRLSQIYNPASGASRVYGAAAANNPPASWIASCRLIFDVQFENERDEDGTLLYEFRDEPVSVTFSENNAYRWEIKRSTNLIYALSAVMDIDSSRTRVPGEGLSECDPDSEEIDFALNPNGGLDLHNLEDWLRNDVAHNLVRNPGVWRESAIYFDGQTEGYGDEYSLQYNTPYLQRALDLINRERSAASRPFIEYTIDYYPNDEDAENYLDHPKPGDELHFFELTYRTLKAFRFIANQMEY